MQKTLIKDLMVPTEKYSTIHENSLLIEAIHTLEKAEKDFEQLPYLHRAVLVYDDDKKIVGKLSQRDVIKSLEPNYENLEDIRSASLSGLSPGLIKNMMKEHSLWQADLDDICNRVSTKRVKEVMYKPTKGEIIEEDSTLGEALHALIIGQHQSLLVTRESEIIGILRLVDMFKLICERIKKCSI